MPNPFRNLGRTAPEDIFWEEVGGAFSCQEPGCYNVSGEAKYADEEKLLTWKCTDGHISKIEGFHIE
jgi:hypothetical protein